jgi:hypothetical protein
MRLSPSPRFGKAELQVDDSVFQIASNSGKRPKQGIEYKNYVIAASTLSQVQAEAEKLPDGTRLVYKCRPRSAANDLVDISIPLPNGETVLSQYKERLYPNTNIGPSSVWLKALRQANSSYQEWLEILGLKEPKMPFFSKQTITALLERFPFRGES